MARVFITGSADGLGRAAAETLLGDGHEVIVPARSAERLTVLDALVGGDASAVVGHLADLSATRAVADQVNRLGPVDAVIHNAGVYSGPLVLPVNVFAPYLLTALIPGPQRLVYLSSGMHQSGSADLAGLEWRGQRATGSYSDSKLLVTTDEPDACTSGGYWYHQRRRTPHPAALEPQFQDELLAALARFTGESL